MENFDLKDLVDKQTMWNNPREGIGHRTGELQHIGVPQDEILYKLEATDMGDNINDVGDNIDTLDGVDEIMIRDNIKDALLDRNNRDGPSTAAGEYFRDPMAQNMLLNLRYNEHTGTGDPRPDHSEMFYGHMDDDPKFMQGVPYQGSGNPYDHTIVRARREEIRMGDNDCNTIPEQAWQDVNISFAKKENLKRTKKLYNVWEWPSYVNYALGDYSRIPLPGQSVREHQMRNDVLVGSEVIKSTKDARDQYGRIFQNRYGMQWYVSPFTKYSQILPVESTTQPRAAIPEYEPKAIGLMYSDYVLHGVENTGVHGRNLPNTSMSTIDKGRMVARRSQHSQSDNNLLHVNNRSRGGVRSIGGLDTTKIQRDTISTTISTVESISGNVREFNKPFIKSTSVKDSVQLTQQQQEHINNTNEYVKMSNKRRKDAAKQRSQVDVYTINNPDITGYVGNGRKKASINRKGGDIDLIEFEDVNRDPIDDRMHVLKSVNPNGFDTRRNLNDSVHSITMDNNDDMNRYYVSHQKGQEDSIRMRGNTNMDDLYQQYIISEHRHMKRSDLPVHMFRNKFDGSVDIKEHRGQSPFDNDRSWSTSRTANNTNYIQRKNFDNNALDDLTTFDDTSMNGYL